jgi:NADH-quinone oxidoreductase subunit K
MIISLTHYFVLSACLFLLGLTGLVLYRQHVIKLLMCIELLLLAVNTQFIATSYYLNQLSAQILVFFILTVAAAETAVVLALLVNLFRARATVSVPDLIQLKG